MRGPAGNPTIEKFDENRTSIKKKSGKSGSNAERILCAMKMKKGHACIVGGGEKRRQSVTTVSPKKR